MKNNISNGVDILKNLNPRQKQAVEITKGPLLILAGPGSGKTRVLTHKIAYLIKRGIAPKNILAVTFTNKAAEEMRERVVKLVREIKTAVKLPFTPLDARRLTGFIGTFHAFCLRVLRKEIKNLDYKSNFIIYDEEDQLKLIKKVIQDLNINKEQFPAKKVSAIISSLKSEVIDWKNYQEQAQEYFEKTISKIYQAYQQKLKKHNALDFDDLIMLAVQLFEQFPEVLKKYQEKFKYILVDECLPYDTPILLEGGGSKAIGEIVENKNHVSVLTFNPKTQKQEIKPIVGWKKISVSNREVLKITVAKRCHKRNRYKTKYKKKTIRRLVCTSNHKIYANGQFIPAKQLKRGDVLQWESSFTRFNLKVCNKCKKVYQTHKTHEARHRTYQKIICPQCGKIYKTKFQYAIHLNKHKNPNYKRKYKLSSKGLKNLQQNMYINNPMSRKEIRFKAGRSRSLYWAKLPPEERDRKLKRFINLPVFNYQKAPTSPEKIIINFKIPGLIYSGKGDRWVTFKNGKHKCPDFIYAYKRKIIEVVDFEYWHTKKEMRELKILYSQINFDCLVLDAKKIFQSPQKTKIIIEKFLNDCPTAVEVTNIQEIKISDKFVYDITIADNHNFYANGILVHNCQDTNPAQYQLIKLLSTKYKNVCCVGDDSQAIYGFRGADFRNILNFEKDFPEAKVITLDQNYRSTQNILDAASKLISKNVFQKPKNLWTENPAGPLISIIETWDEKSEAELIIKKILEFSQQGFKLNDFTVFYRTNAQSRALEEAFIRHNILYKLVGAIKFYQRKEIKDIVSYLKFIDTNDLISLERIINVPTRGIGKTTFNKIINQGLSNIAKQRPEVNAFYNFIKKAKKISLEKPLSQLLKFILKEINYQDYLKKLYSDAPLRVGIPEDEIRWQNIQELINVSSDYDRIKPPQGLKEFLEKTALLSEHDEVEEKKELVNLMTLHTAKGLEFPIVFIVGCEEGVLPHSRSLLNPLDLEEERRLFYVGITRSKKYLYLVFSQQRANWGGKEANPPSRFLGEIPEELIKFEEYNKEIDDIDF